MAHFEMSIHCGSSCQIAVIEYHIFVGSPQLGCILTSLADNLYAYTSLFKENNAEVNILSFGLHALL